MSQAAAKQTFGECARTMMEQSEIIEKYDLRRSPEVGLQKSIKTGGFEVTCACGSRSDRKEDDRMSDYFGKEVGKLGFGLMRLPKKLMRIDIEETIRMVDAFMEAGFTYFDTAYVYVGSEDAARKALVKRYPRESYTLATKLNAMMAPTEKMAKQQFFTSLKRTGAEYFDYYLMHALMEGSYSRYDRMKLWEFALEQKEKGLIRHLGFSFHASPQLLDQVLREHPEAEFVQLQINYADWENASVASRANYEVARKHGKSIVIMEPVKGGRLADPPKNIKKLFQDYNPELSYASWAIRFAASLEGVITVLSGMSDLEQMQDNLSYMKDFKPFNKEEQAIIREVIRQMGNDPTVQCTACHYCTEGCPKQIPIPDIFKALNHRLSTGQIEESRRMYEDAVTVENDNGASACIACGQCEAVCPQHIKVIEELKRSKELLEI